jgi:retinol dehydrogenase 12
MSIIRSQRMPLPYPETSFAGQTIIVTGGNTGVGLEAARHFVRLNAARVIISSRSATKGEAAKQSIEESTRRTGVVEVWELDLQRSESIRAFAARAERELQRIDVVIENAGLSAGTFALAEGHEASITVNVLNTLQLALLLLPKLRASAAQDRTRCPPRLVIVSSEVHSMSTFKDWNSTDILASATQRGKKSMGGGQYNDTKLMGLLLARELAAHVSADEVIVETVNPGICKSELGRDQSFGVRVAQKISRAMLARTSEVGSRNYMAAAALGREAHGAYVSDCNVDE